MLHKFSSVSYFRNFIFGIEDGLVSTVGLLSGIAAADISKTTIVITGIVLIFVEGISMAAGSFLSEHSVDEYTNQKEELAKTTIISALIMFFSYFLSGLIPLFPYMIFSVDQAFIISIVLSLIFLFILGIISAKISKTSVVKDALRMVFVGGLAIAVGVIAGNFLTNLK